MDDDAAYVTTPFHARGQVRAARCDARCGGRTSARGVGPVMDRGQNGCAAGDRSWFGARKQGGELVRQLIDLARRGAGRRGGRLRNRLGPSIAMSRTLSWAAGARRGGALLAGRSLDNAGTRTPVRAPALGRRRCSASHTSSRGCGGIPWRSRTERRRIWPRGAHNCPAAASSQSAP